MSLAIVFSRAQTGISAPLITVETHLSNGLPSLSIVGLPETVVKESKDRVRSALLTARYEFPYRRITINLAPADLPKEGSRFDLAIAVGVLAASKQIPKSKLNKYEFVGELALSGELRRVSGVIPTAMKTRQAGRILVIPKENAKEAALVSDLKIMPANHLLEICAHLCGEKRLPLYDHTPINSDKEVYEDLADVCAQYQAKRALEIAAAGAHSLLMIGPPGTGKSMLASRLPGILPPMTEDEALETAAVQSIAGKDLNETHWQQRPFRAPHHTASGVALVGGGSYPRPGEISLAHNGVMFLDELPEFGRRVLEVLREPMETGHITISRAAHQAEFPARFQFVAAMNPCPCGYLGHPNGRCHCSPDQIQRYRSRVSGPLLDRIDIHIEVPPITKEILQRRAKGNGEEDSAQVRDRVNAARKRQWARSSKPNCMLTNQQVNEYCKLDRQNICLLEKAIDRLGLSARAYHRILKVARTIADLDEQGHIQSAHISEAIGYRRLDRYGM